MAKETFTRRWTTDARGNRVLYGLTAEETAFHEAYLRTRTTAERRQRLREELKARRLRFLELHDKHVLARRQAALAEAEERTANSRID